MIFFIIQIISLFWMVYQFRSYIELKPYYSKMKLFQVSVIMYCEVVQCVMVVLFSFTFRFFNLEALLRKCKSVLTDLNKVDVPFFVRNFGIIGVSWTTLFVIYRTRNSTRRMKMMVPFWIGMNQIILLKSLVLMFLSIANTSCKNINKELREVLANPSRNAKHLQMLVFQLSIKHQRASNLMDSIFKDFGPDVLFMCLFFLFKITFVLYHLNLTLGENTWGNNSLLGEMTAYIQVLQLVFNMYSLNHVTDSLFEQVSYRHGSKQSPRAI